MRRCNAQLEWNRRNAERASQSALATANVAGADNSGKEGAMEQLIQSLLASYGQTERTFCRDAAGGISFRIDDQHPTDNGPRFCQITLHCDTSGGLTLELTNCPTDATVRAFLDNHGAKVNESWSGQDITCPLPAKRRPQAVRQLATLIRRVVGRGRTYRDRNWKWQCPRAANSLDALADAMTRAELMGRSGVPAR